MRWKMAAWYTCVVLTVYVTCHLGLTYADQHDINMMLLQKIEALEKQGEAQKAHITQLEGDLKNQGQHIRYQATQIATLREQGHRQQTSNHKSAGALSNSHKKLVHSLKTAKSQKKRLVLDQSESVVFYAKIAKQTLYHIAVNGTVVFEKADVNLGGGYNTNTGVFTAPRHGIYLLATSFVSPSLHDHHEIHLSLRSNGQELAKVMAHGDSGHLDQGSTTVVTTLSQGDKVSLANIGDPDNSLGGDGYSNFMGVLLYEM